MKNIYNAPVLTVIEFNTEDVITTSSGMGVQNDDIGNIALYD